MSDLIDRQAAIDALGERPMVWVGGDYELGARNQYDADVLALETVPSAQPGQLTGVQDILQYLDEYLHPIVSPEHWSVYSELYDMVSMLPSAQPEETHEKRTETHARDLIDRQAAIDALGEKPLVWDDLSDFELGKATQWADDVDAIKALASAQPKSSESKRDLSDTISRQAAIDANTRDVER